MQNNQLLSSIFPGTSANRTHKGNLTLVHAMAALQVSQGNRDIYLPLIKIADIGPDGLQYVVNEISKQMQTRVVANIVDINEPIILISREIPPLAVSDAGVSQGPKLYIGGSDDFGLVAPDYNAIGFNDLSPETSFYSAAGVPHPMAGTEPQPRVGRPPNAFILYRKHHHEKVKKANPGFVNNEISIEIGKMWREERDEVKAFWKKRAEDVKIDHFMRHPTYVYTPRRPGQKRRRVTARSIVEKAQEETKKDEIDIEQEIATALAADNSTPSTEKNLEGVDLDLPHFGGEFSTQSLQKNLQNLDSVYQSYQEMGTNELDHFDAFAFGQEGYANDINLFDSSFTHRDEPIDIEDTSNALNFGETNRRVWPSL